MQNHWLEYLDSLIIQPLNAANSDILFPRTGLSVLTVSGEDAETFLQGQLTCNVRELAIDQVCLAGFCTAKGRVISTLLCLRTQAAYLLILPQSLLEPVQKKLQMYILRAKVRLSSLEDWCVLGLMRAKGHPDQAAYSVDIHEGWQIRLPTPSSLYLRVCTSKQAIATCQIAQQAEELASLADWQFYLISGGMPWFDASQSEQFIPQMLNLDQLGGISFNKGCYTGQEIVARTHYLGQVKRCLFLGQATATSQTDENATLVDANTGQVIGHIVCQQNQGDLCRLLMVLPMDVKTPILMGGSGHSVQIIHFQ